jgi:hypothetical protein
MTGEPESLAHILHLGNFYMRASTRRFGRTSPRDNLSILKRAALLLVLGLMMNTLTSCQFTADERVPNFLLGKWRTDAPRYKGLNFEITDNNLIFTTVEGSLNTYSISAVERSVKGDTISTVFYGQQNDVRINVGIFYEAANGGQIRLRNQLNVIWKRVASV